MAVICGSGGGSGGGMAMAMMVAKGGGGCHRVGVVMIVVTIIRVLW